MDDTLADWIEAQAARHEAEGGGRAEFLAGELRGIADEVRQLGATEPDEVARLRRDRSWDALLAEEPWRQFEPAGR